MRPCISALLASNSLFRQAPRRLVAANWQALAQNRPLSSSRDELNCTMQRRVAKLEEQVQQLLQAQKQFPVAATLALEELSKQDARLSNTIENLSDDFVRVQNRVLNKHKIISAELNTTYWLGKEQLVIKFNEPHVISTVGTAVAQWPQREDTHDIVFVYNSKEEAEAALSDLQQLLPSSSYRHSSP